MKILTKLSISGFVLILIVSLLILFACTVEKEPKVLPTDLTKFEYVQFFWADTMVFRVAANDIVSASRKREGDVWYWTCRDKSGADHIFVLSNMRRIVIKGDW